MQGQTEFEEVDIDASEVKIDVTKSLELLKGAAAGAIKGDLRDTQVREMDNLLGASKH